MRINVAVPESHVTPPVLNAALEATTRLNESLLKSGEVPLFDQVRDRIRWKPEPPGDEHFDHAGVVLGRRWGDCDDMAPYAAASMRATGEDRGARAVVKRSGPKRWHAVVQRSDGTIRDPSKETGMGQHHGIKGAGLPMMYQPAVVGGTYIARPQLAMRPVTDRDGQVEAWQARADLPWHWAPGKGPADVAMVSLHASPISSQSIVGACEGLIALGEANDVPDELLDRAAAIIDCCEGADYDELADEYGEETAQAAGQLVGSFFGGFGSLLKKGLNVANPFNLVKYVPGVGPVAAKFMPTTENILKYGPSAATFIPGVGPAVAPMLQQAAPMLQQYLQPGGGGGLARRPSPVPAQAFNMASPELQRLLAQGLHLPPVSDPGGYGRLFGRQPLEYRG